MLAVSPLTFDQLLRRHFKKRVPKRPNVSLKSRRRRKKNNWKSFFLQTLNRFLTDSTQMLFCDRVIEKVQLHSNCFWKSSLDQS